MYVKCPEGWTMTRKVKLGRATVTVHHSKVQIYAGICDSADLCKRTECRFYNTSPEATRLFCRAQAEEHTLEALQRRLNPH
jgi:hypothetical protein